MGRMKTNEEFVAEVFELVGNEYEVLSKYRSAIKDIKMKHKKCGHEYNVLPPRFTSDGIRCNKCAVKRRTKTHDEFVSELHELVGNKYEILDRYKNSKVKVNVKHKKCGAIYKTTPGNLLSGKRCLNCTSKERFAAMTKTQADFEHEVFNLVNKEYKILTKYKNSHTKIKVKHNLCNHVYEVSPSHLLNGRRCPRCNGSKGEKAVSKYLKEISFNYKEEYRIKECRDKNPLPFDFAIFQNSELLCLIEYEGIQHFEKIGHWNNVRGSLKEVKRRDQIKRDYCKNNGIPLIEIPYWEQDNIELILDAELNKIEKKSAPINLEMGKKESVLL